MAHVTRLEVRAEDIDANGHVRDSKYVDYAAHARWQAVIQAGLDPRALAAAAIGPIHLEVTVKYLKELVLGDEVEVQTRFEYPKPKIVRVLQTLTRVSDGAPVAEVASTTGLLDLRRRQLLDDARQTWRKFLTDTTVIDSAQ